MHSTAPGGVPAGNSPFLEFDRKAWAPLAQEVELALTKEDVVRLRGLGDPLDLREVKEIYLPLSRLLNLHIQAQRNLHRSTSAFLHGHAPRTPFVIGVAGSVAVGKSTVSRLLREMMARFPDTPRVELVTTDGFLHPNAELARRGLMERKGFPESYDRKALLRFVSAVKGGVAEVRAPWYSHLTYDIVPGKEVVVRQPDVLIVEGLNVLAPARPDANGRFGLAVSDFFDFSIYVDARRENIERWYVDRFLSLRRGAFTDPESYFNRITHLSEEESADMARSIWKSINEPNLIDNVRPTRGRATLVLRKDQDHAVHKILLRKQ